MKVGSALAVPDGYDETVPGAVPVGTIGAAELLEMVYTGAVMVEPGATGVAYVVVELLAGTAAALDDEAAALEAAALLGAGAGAGELEAAAVEDTGAGAGVETGAGGVETGAGNNDVGIAVIGHTVV